MRQPWASGRVLAMVAILAVSAGGCASVEGSADVPPPSEVDVATSEADAPVDGADVRLEASPPNSDAGTPDAPCARQNLPICVGDSVWYVDTCGEPWTKVEECAWGCEGGSCRPCQPSCDGRQCGPDGCGGSCGPCGVGQACTPEGVCCDRQCEGRACGPDACGGTCGACGFGEACGPDGRCVPCPPACDGLECGPDGCGGSCGVCPSGLACDAGRCLEPADPDGDGFATDDCRPWDAAAHPVAPEACNARDDDCDGLTDEAACAPCATLVWGGHTYLACSAPLSWHDARSACRARGYRLASVESLEEALFLDTTISGDAWIGATDEAVEGAFTWDNGSTSTFSYWHTKEPNDKTHDHNCVEMVHGSPNLGRWNDNACTVLHGWLCESGCGEPPDTQPDGDGDGVGDGCDDWSADSANDADGDGLGEADDNCPLHWNPGQEDSDADGQGEACDAVFGP